MAGTYTITSHNPADDTDEQIAERVALANLLNAEVLPDDPPTPVAQAIASHRAVPGRVRRWSFRARDDAGRLVGIAATSVDPEHDENPDLFFLGINVLADHRRNGIGTRLLGELVRLARAEGRTRLVGQTNERVPGGEAFARAIGATAQQANHLNHLPVEEVDRGLLERWVAEGPERADGYELLVWDDECPEEHAEAYVELVKVMNTAPRDGLQLNDFDFTVEQLREVEARSRAAGYHSWTVVARRRSDGELAGFHDLNWDPADPTVGWVGATGVQPEHRGHALGKWLKASLMLRVLDEKPEVVDIRTGNADSNDAMLGINRLMGYRPMIASTVWEVSVADAEKWLADRGALA